MLGFCERILVNFGKKCEIQSLCKLDMRAYHANRMIYYQIELWIDQSAGCHDEKQKGRTRLGHLVPEKITGSLSPKHN